MSKHTRQSLSSVWITQGQETGIYSCGRCWTVRTVILQDQSQTVGFFSYKGWEEGVLSFCADADPEMGPGLSFGRMILFLGGGSGWLN